MLIRNDLIGCYVARPNTTRDGHEFLQLRRAATDYMGGTWQTVAGCMETGETAWQAALRELFEETGLQPIDFYRSAIVASFYMPGPTPETDQLFHQVMFLAIVSREVEITLNSEHDEYRWIRREEIVAKFMWPEDRKILRHLCEDILDGGLCAPHLKITHPLEGWRNETSGPALAKGRSNTQNPPN
jgi:dATP pyrophosphohydrolase